MFLVPHIHGEDYCLEEPDATQVTGNASDIGEAGSTATYAHHGTEQMWGVVARCKCAAWHMARSRKVFDIGVTTTALEDDALEPDTYSIGSSSASYNNKNINIAEGVYDSAYKDTQSNQDLLAEYHGPTMVVALTPDTQRPVHGILMNKSLNHLFGNNHCPQRRL